MRFLLDTHALLWWLFDDPRLSPAAREVVAEPQNEIFVSAASAWEIATKFRLGKLAVATELVQDIDGWIRRAGFAALPVAIVHAQRAGAWPHPHRDPFDRMLAAQSSIEELQLITQDPAFESFGIRVFW
ncbi:MAG: type II toxin-antitoxin system VapC family toxin [Thermoanaerobaculia bacterium]